MATVIIIMTVMVEKKKNVKRDGTGKRHEQSGKRGSDYKTKSLEF